MKTLSSILLTATLMLGLAPALFADVAIYSGNAIVRTTSGDGDKLAISNMNTIVDLATGASQEITLFRHAKPKQFHVEPALASTMVTVAKGKTAVDLTVISFANTSTDATTGVTTASSLLLKGRIGSAIIKGTTKSDVARELSGTSAVVSTSGVDPATSAAIASALVISTPMLTLKPLLSKTANDAGHTTVGAALADVKAALIAAGFVEKP